MESKKKQTCETEAQNHIHKRKDLKQKHCMRKRSKIRKTRVRVSGQDHVHARTSLHAQAGLCARGIHPRNPSNTENRVRL